MGCTNLTVLEIPNSVTTIEVNAFSVGIKKLIIGENVEDMGPNFPYYLIK